MSFQPSSIRFKEFGATGAPLAAGRLYTYASGTTTHKAAYTDATLGTPQSYTTDGSGNKYITLDPRGEARVWLGSGAYTFVVTDSDGANSRTVDGVQDPKGEVDTLRADLADASDDAKGAALIGDDPALDYPDKSVGYMIKIANQPVNILKVFGKTEADAIQAKTSTTNHQAALADVLANERAVYFPYGKYNANAAINLGSHNVSLYGHFDAEISVTDGAFTFLRYTGAQRFEIRGLKIYGTEHTTPTVKLLQIDTSSAYFLIDGTEFAYASQDLILDGCYIGKVRGTKHSNSDVFLKIAASLASSTDINVSEATFGTSTVGTSSLVQISAPDIQLNGYWETQQKVKASLEVLSGGRPTVTGRLVDSGPIIARTSALLDLDVIMTNSWDSVNNYAIRADGGSLVDLNSSYIRATSFATGIVGVSGSGTLRGAGFEVANFATGISSSSDVLLSAGAVSGCTTGIVASGSGIVGPIDYSSNTTNATISGTVVQYQDLVGTDTYDPPNLAGGATQQTTVTVTGAAVGDTAQASFSVANAGIAWSAEFTSADTATVTQRNLTGGAIDLPSGTIKVRGSK